MEDNRFDCHELCDSTQDLNNKCDGNCIGGVPNREFLIVRKDGKEHKNITNKKLL